jgi:betaine-aldehyde dehydrogenase
MDDRMVTPAQDHRSLPAHRALFYGGAWHEPAGGYAPTYNPATGETLGMAAQSNREDVDAAVRAAHAAFGQWRHTSFQERAARLQRLAAVLRANSSEFARIDSLNCGNPVRELERDAIMAAQQAELFAGLSAEIKGSTLRTGTDTLNMTLREPYGVCARLVAYNHPLMFTAGKAAAALAAGNTVIMKSPPQAPLSAMRLAELAGDIFPPGVFNILSGGAECGVALTDHPKVPVITLIGSVATGRAVMKGAADRLKHVLLELGGKNALIVYPDADVPRAIAGAVKGMNFGWCGQSCGSTSRLFIHDSLYEQVLAGVIAQVAEIRPGIPSDPATQMGCLISKAQYDRVVGYIATARQEGARLVLGGKHPADAGLQAGFFIEPTIFADVQPTMTIAKEEIFGPVLAVFRWSDEAALFDAVNGVEYGLTASIFTTNLATAHRAAARVEAGYVWINTSSVHYPGTPFGGFKQSGIGREESIEELLEFTQLKAVHISL